MSSPGPTLNLALSPAGRVYLEDQAAADNAPPPAAAERIRRAFAQGSGSGLLHLGAVELGTTPERVSDEKYKAIRKLRSELGVEA